MIFSFIDFKYTEFLSAQQEKQSSKELEMNHRISHNKEKEGD